MSKGTTTERLTRMEDNQDQFAEAIKAINVQLKSQDEKLDLLNKKFDELTGGKQALMWVTGIALTVSGLVLAFINVNKH
jgi:uncharacterized coiled-coil protein SlyX